MESTVDNYEERINTIYIYIYISHTCVREIYIYISHMCEMNMKDICSCK